MRKYTDQSFLCSHCDKKNYFLVSVHRKDEQAYYVTQCPRCKHYDEVKNISLDEYEVYAPKVS